MSTKELATSTSQNLTAPAGLGRLARLRSWWVFRRGDLTVAALAVALRLPLIGAPARPDEAGYLLVAAAAHPHGPHLYGDLWVDRPPLLIAFFAVADALGGLQAMRVLALGPVVVLVLAASSAGRAVAGPRVARAAGLVAAALSATPLLGAPEVDGELLATPLVMLAFALGLQSLGTGTVPQSPDRQVWVMALGGVAGACALLVKQNFVDGLVFLLVVLLASTASHRVTRRQGVVLGAALTVGALLAVLLAVVWALAWGAGPTGLWQALFAFRAESLRVIARGTEAAPEHRALVLALAAVASGLGLMLIAWTVAVVRDLHRPGHPHRLDPVGLAVVAVLAVGTCSIALGGSYWRHYLLELVPATCLCAAALARIQSSRRPARTDRLARAALVVVLASAVVATAVQVPAARAGGCATQESGAAAVSSWLARRSLPGDTAMLLYGGANALLGSGASPASTALWSLPVRVLDPRLGEHVAALEGPQPPTWVIQTLPLHSWGLDHDDRLQHALEQRYAFAGTVCDTSIYLRRDTSRLAHPMSRTSR